ncbi:hypothetical protein C9374_006583 [Naegleria lovaniensis]|uniref:Uncharacterized protein n=1 Tax=Naegleria lovaniensis TaxID=51637 RepID=A0AA88KIR8_NAELO|nr:uncharacterized protein C9374_006583 [Naegleria lovaniensis]KAG2379466.1 hypothetical protein C9374_006583 [Naegleria lovaniensis]
MVNLESGNTDHQENNFEQRKKALLKFLFQKTTLWAIITLGICCVFGLSSIILGGIADNSVDLTELTVPVPCLIQTHRMNCTNECINNGLDIVPSNTTLSNCRTFCKSQVLVMLPSSYNTTTSQLNQTRITLPYASSTTFFNYSIGTTTKCFINMYTINQNDVNTAFAYTIGPRLGMRVAAIVLGCIALGCFVYLGVFVAYELVKYCTSK